MTALPASRVPPPPEGHQLRTRKMRAPGNTILNQPQYRRPVSADRLNREGSRLATSLEGEARPTPAENTLPHSYPKTRFRRERARVYYLLTVSCYILDLEIICVTPAKRVWPRKPKTFFIFLLQQGWGSSNFSCNYDCGLFLLCFLLANLSDMSACNGVLVHMKIICEHSC